MIEPTLHCPCSGRHRETAFEYDTPPAGETIFDFGGQRYRRSYERCALCGHWFSNNSLDMSSLYKGAYVDNTYGERLRQTFERIVALPPGQSDNAGRVACLLDFARGHLAPGTKPRLLDVGSGLGIFPYHMKQAGWRCTAVDPDERATQHAHEAIGIDAVTGDFMKLDTAALGLFDVVTFNKVLEHVNDPVGMLRGAHKFLDPHGFVYVEVPDGEMAVEHGPEREEFFIEHLHVFSFTSVVMLANRAGFAPIVVERLQEPSTKFTLRAFLVPVSNNGSLQSHE